MDILGTVVDLLLKIILRPKLKLELVNGKFIEIKIFDEELIEKELLSFIDKELSQPVIEQSKSKSSDEKELLINEKTSQIEEVKILLEKMIKIKELANGLVGPVQELMDTIEKTLFREKTIEDLKSEIEDLIKTTRILWGRNYKEIQLKISNKGHQMASDISLILTSPVKLEEKNVEIKIEFYDEEEYRNLENIVFSNSINLFPKASFSGWNKEKDEKENKQILEFEISRLRAGEEEILPPLILAVGGKGLKGQKIIRLGYQIFYDQAVKPVKGFIELKILFDKEAAQQSLEKMKKTLAEIISQKKLFPNLYPD